MLFSIQKFKPKLKVDQYPIWINLYEQLTIFLQSFSHQVYQLMKFYFHHVSHVHMVTVYCPHNICFADMPCWGINKLGNSIDSQNVALARWKGLYDKRSIVFASDLFTFLTKENYTRIWKLENVSVIKRYKTVNKKNLFVLSAVFSKWLLFHRILQT